MTREQTDRDPEKHEALERYVRLTDGPLMVLAVLMIPVLVAPVFARLDERMETVLLAIDWFI